MSESTGVVTRLQIQSGLVKVRGVGYRPDQIVSVAELAIGPRGAFGFDGEQWVVDMHHADHPKGRGGGNRPLSLGTASRYQRMGRRYGDVVTPGVAGENIVVDLPADPPTGSVVIHTSDHGEVRLPIGKPLAPCIEFTSHLLRRDTPADRESIADDLEFLDGGTRGWAIDPSAIVGHVVVRVGDRVELRS